MRRRLSSVWGKGVGLAALFLATLSSAVIVEAEKSALENGDAWGALREEVRRGIADGAWDGSNLLLRSRRNGERIKVTSADFQTWSVPLREAVTDKLLSYYSSNALSTYHVRVDAGKNKLEQEPVLESLGIDVTSLTGLIPAEKLLSRYAQTWAYKLSPGYGPNCWHTSIASVSLHWLKPRRMPPAEFACHVRTSFTPIDRPSQWGDLIRLASGNEEVHGLTYLGTDSKDPNRILVFTKNGRAQSYFLFMDLETVKNYVYPGNQVSYFRQVRAAVDPMEDPSAPCAGMPSDDGWEENNRDPIIEAGLRHDPNPTIE